MKQLFTITVFLIGGLTFSYGQYNIEFAGQIPYSDTTLLSGCWGYTADDGAEYALVGTIHGTSIVDISNPTDPQELFFVPGATSTWREIKTWNHHAYVSTEGGGGMMIIDLSELPDAIDTISYHGTIEYPLNTAHTLFIDENGYCYLFGYNILTGATEGAYIVELNTDPKHPEYVSQLNTVYIHDGFVRNDTLWAACIYEGNIEVFDVTNKNAITLLGEQPTSASASHNCWLSDDGKYLFTTDEIWTGFISAFDVTDVTDMREIDQVKHGAADSTVAHNTYYLNGYLVTAHYTEGVTIHDAVRPDNLIEVAHYDTSPFGPEVILEGAWGVYPYFPSGTIIISDITEGLVVLTPTYQRAAYLEGTVKDVVSFNNIVNANVEIIGTGAIDSTDIIGEYKTGYHEPGMYDVVVSKTGCITQTITNVELLSASVTNLDILLDCGTIPVNDIAQNNAISCSYNASIWTVEIDNAFSENVDGALLTLEGQVIFKFSIPAQQHETFDVAKLPKGVYLVQLSAEDTRKLVIY